MTRAGLLAMAALVMGAGRAAAAGPSFDCGKAASADERLICSDPALAQADADLAGVYHTVLGGLWPAARPVFEASERSWLRFVGLNCSVPKARSPKDRAACVTAGYRFRARQLFDSQQKFGLYDVLRVHAYALIDLVPAASDEADQAGPTIERETYDYLQNASGFPPLAEGAEAWNAWVTPKGLLTGATVYPGDPKRDADGPEGAFRTVKILDATDQVIVFERSVVDKTTLRGSDIDDDGVWLLHEARRASLADLFRAGTPWATTVASRVNADTDKSFPKADVYERSEPSSFKVSADGLSIDSGHIDGFAQPQHVTTIPWADLKTFLSERGRTVVDSFSR